MFIPVRAELVEALLFTFERGNPSEVQPFDKLRANGVFGNG
jgi:hypothetical protein